MNETARLLALLSAYLTATPRAVTADDVSALAADCHIPPEDAFLALLSAYLGLDSADLQDAALARSWLPKMVRRLDPELITRDPYVLALRAVEATCGSFRLTREHYEPMELFVRDDFREENGRVYPLLGYFTQRVPYPAVMENGRIWMTVTPNEIHTIRPAAQASHGKVLAYGLGLGYFAFHALMNPRVESVTVVERSRDVIALFERHLLPGFPRRDALRILRADAFDYAKNTAPQEHYDTVFTDLWHDVSDGLPLYRQMKALETPGPTYLYWIEQTLRYYE